MIKICHIVGRLAYGGAEKLLLDICRKIDKEKFAVSVIVLKSGENDNPLAGQFADAGIPIKYFAKRGKLDFTIIKKVALYLREIKPDIVHTHLFMADYWGGKAARLARVKKIISTKHDVLSEGFWRDYLGRQVRRKFDKIIAISRATREYLVEVEKISADRIEVIYNGIDVGRFNSENDGILKKPGLIIGSVGRLAKEKGHKHLIRACLFLKNKDWRLILVGDGSLRKELENLAELLDIADRVEFVGAVPDVRPYLEKMDIFVLPSVSEGLSLVVLEAAMFGRAVVATNVGGVPEIIRDKETGLLFKPKKIEQLVAHLNWLDDHREAAVKMADALRREVQNKFDINKTIKQYEELYSKLVKS